MAQYACNIARTNLTRFCIDAMHIVRNMEARLAGSSSSKREKFRELASSRADKALEAIERIGNLSNVQLYEWDQAEVKKIIKARRDEVSRVEARFESPGRRRRERFTL